MSKNRKKAKKISRNLYHKLLQTLLFIILCLFTAVIIVGGNRLAAPDPAKKILTITAQDFTDDPLPTFFPSVRALLEFQKDDPVIGSLVNKVEKELDGYERLVQGVKEYSSGLHIDLLLQDHGELDEKLARVQKVVNSQKRVAHRLGAESYDMIGVEGLSIDPITINGLVDAIVNYDDPQTTPTTKAQAQEMLDASLPTSGFLQYLKKNPSAMMTGIEYENLNRLHRLILNDLMSQAHGQGGRLPIGWLVDADSLLSRLRSEIAVAKAAGKLKSLNKKRGVIIIGYAHKEDLVRSLKYLHITSDVWDTLDPM